MRIQINERIFVVSDGSMYAIVMVLRWHEVVLKGAVRFTVQDARPSLVLENMGRSYSVPWVCLRVF